VITQQISMRTHLERKQVDDVMGGEEAWASVDQTDGEFWCWQG
jgi:DNA-directed RNA polymerase III subunit RPC11